MKIKKIKKYLHCRIADLQIKIDNLKEIKNDFEANGKMNNLKWLAIEQCDTRISNITTSMQELQTLLELLHNRKVSNASMPTIDHIPYSDIAHVIDGKRKSLQDEGKKP